MPELAEWENFYVIVGSSAGALIGLQFVVLTLIAERPSIRAADAGAAFLSPTIVHFSAVLLLAAFLSAPWHVITFAAIMWGLMGIGGAAYVVIVVLRMRTQTLYRPDLEDWMFHTVLPLAAYVLLALSSLAGFSYAREALFGVGAAALLLLFIGIHNAWDGVAYQVFVALPKAEAKRQNDQTQ